MNKTANETVATKQWFTFPVAGAAYRTLTIKATHTHSYDPKADKVLCGKVKPESILEDWVFDTDATPTCPCCAKRLAKLA